MKPRSAKNKGKRFQNWVRDLILEVFPELEADDVRSTSMGVQGEDIQLSPKARKYFPYNVECKANKSFAVYNIMQQAETHGTSAPIAFLKGDRKKPLVVLYADDFVELLKQTRK